MLECWIGPLHDSNTPLLHCCSEGNGGEARKTEDVICNSRIVMRWNTTMPAEAPLMLRCEAALDCAPAPDPPSKDGRAQNHRSQSDPGKR